jgi:hypothetical protein
MPEVNQYLFNHKELLELLIKKADVHEGKWILMANMGFSPGNFGPNPGQMSPGAAVVIMQMGFQRAAPETPLEMIVDASVVNPTPKVVNSNPKAKK